MPVFFLTDLLLFALLAFALGFGFYAAGQEHLRAPWRSVLRSRIGAVALVVLSAYGFVGLLDSVHFHPKLPPQEATTGPSYSPEILSLLDLWLTSLRTQQEKTYSAPFATHLYAKEQIRLPDGQTVRDYPRLRFGGAHLEDPATQKAGAIARRSLIGLLQAFGVWVLFVALLLGWQTRRRGYKQALSWIFRDPPHRAALLTFGVLLALGFVVAALAPYYHVFGTDKVGEDVLYQGLKSIRTGLVIGTLTTLIMLPLAVLLGILAGYFRGLADDLIQYLYTTLNSIPSVLLIAAAVLMLQVYMNNHAEAFTSLAERADLRLFFLCLILGITSWTGLCRLLRGEALKLREMDFVQAAQALGVGSLTILGRHILPNVLHIVLISVVLDFSGLVLAEAVLSYINIGVDPSMNSWGNMINSARLELAREPIVWWSLSCAFLLMFTLVLFANLFADVVRDALDPRLRGARP